MALAYNHEEITPRELKPALLELDGISRETVEAHYKLYQGYVNKRNEILGKLDGVDLTSANQVYSELRSLKVDLTFAIGGIKNHEIYFEHLGGRGGEPAGVFGDLVKRDFGSVADWKADLKATGLAGRGWAWTAYDWDEGRLFNYIGDAAAMSSSALRRQPSRWGCVRAGMTTWEGQLAGQIGLLVAVILVIRILPRGISGLILHERA